MKKCFVTLILSTLSICCTAQQINEAQSYEAKFDSLEAIYNAHLSTDSAFYYIHSLDLLARASNNDDFVGIVSCITEQEYFNANSNKIVSYIDSILPRIKKIENPRYLTIIMSDLILYYTNNYQYQTALNKLQELKTLLKGRETNYTKAFVCESEALICLGLEKYNESFSYFEKGHEYLGVEVNEKDQTSYNRLQIMLYIQQIRLLLISEDYKKLLDISTPFQLEIEKANADPKLNKDKYYTQDVKLALHACRLIAYSELGQLTNANQEYNMLKNYEKPEMDSIPFYQAMSAYYKAIKNYPLALDNLDTALKLSGVSVSDQVPLLKIKMKIFEGMDNYKRAFEILNELDNKENKIEKQKFSAQVNELIVWHKVSQLKEQYHSDNQKINYTMALSLVIMISLLLVIFLIYRLSLTLKAKNKSLYNQLKEHDTLKSEVTNLQSQLLHPHDTMVENSDLFSRLETLMQEKKIYTDSRLTRDTLIELLETDRPQLSALIQARNSLSINDYINKYRLEHARKLITENLEMNFKEIYYSSGFTSKSTFYRLFSDHFGLTPSELRNVFLE